MKNLLLLALVGGVFTQVETANRNSAGSTKTANKNSKGSKGCGGRGVSHRFTPPLQDVKLDVSVVSTIKKQVQNLAAQNAPTQPQPIVRSVTVKPALNVNSSTQSTTDTSRINQSDQDFNREASDLLQLTQDLALQPSTLATGKRQEELETTPLTATQNHLAIAGYQAPGIQFSQSSHEVSAHIDSGLKIATASPSQLIHQSVIVVEEEESVRIQKQEELASGRILTREEILIVSHLQAQALQTQASTAVINEEVLCQWGRPQQVVALLKNDIKGFFECVDDDGCLVEIDVKIINEIAPNGNTYLHLAAMLGNTEMTAQLLSFGANRTIENKQGFTAAEVALNKETKAIIENHAALVEALSNVNGTSVDTATVQQGTCLIM